MTSRRSILPALLFAAAFGALLQGQTAKRIVTYYGNQRVEVPQKVERVATAWEAQNSIIAMLGYGDRIVATTRLVRSMPIFQKFVPSIRAAGLASNGGSADISVEELLVRRPDILFVPSAIPRAKMEQLSRAGIAVANFRSNSLDAIVERTLITGEMLGPDALQIAQEYQRYFERNRRRVHAALAAVPAAKRVKVYHAVGRPLTTSGRPSLNQDWMDLGGAINVAEGWFQGTSNTSGVISVEAIVAADPEVILAMNLRDAVDIRIDPQWQKIRAVRNGRVYANPRGLFYWCRESSEEALQFLWVAKTLYPEVLKDVDMAAETKAFYKTFYRINLSDAEVKEFLIPTT